MPWALSVQPAVGADGFEDDLGLGPGRHCTAGVLGVKVPQIRRVWVGMVMAVLTLPIG